MTATARAAVILAGGALGYRKSKKMEELAKLLAEPCPQINDDQHGRGDSKRVLVRPRRRSDAGRNAAAPAP
jgi:hypothetical protein